MKEIIESREREYFEIMNNSLMNGAKDFCGIWITFAKCERYRTEKDNYLQKDIQELQQRARRVEGEDANRIVSDIKAQQTVISKNQTERRNLEDMIDQLNDFWLFDINELYHVVQRKVEGPNIIELSNSIRAPIIIQNNPEIILRHPFAEFTKNLLLDEEEQAKNKKEEQKKENKKKKVKEK